jgi:aryl-alcohol dehydrogenase-like predicted oxidoreductase
MLKVLPFRRIGPYQVRAVGFGCMNISHAYGVPPPPERGAQLLQKAYDLGVDFFDTATLYGFGTNEELVGKTLKPVRNKILLASKGGMAGVDGRRVINGRPEALRRNCEDSLRRLQTDVIDLYYLHRWDKTVPIEDSVGELSILVKEGKIRQIGLSEVSAVTIQKAHAIHPIAAVQTEYSLWTRNPEISVLKTCKENDISFVAFSPLARGYLGGELRDVNNLDVKDIRQSMPRFSKDNYPKNVELLFQFDELAKSLDCSMAQLAIAWLLNKDDFIIPIPGTTQIKHLIDNMGATSVRLTKDIADKLEILFDQKHIYGARYNEATQKEIDTEEF